MANLQNLQTLIAAAAIFVALLSLFFAFLAFAKLRTFDKKLTLLFAGKEAKDLEKIILDQATQIKQLDKEIQELFEISNQIHNLAFRATHKVGIVRFNPFKDIGGNQSFAIAFLDGKHNGVVISSLHTREGTRVYAKPITKGLSEKYTLTDEEKQAIQEASIAKIHQAV